mmetsp:Transcript_28111/g.61542  ORF Transcript_28111/g.61542 Transcript_28111/m.61542 type:complete len:172 (-) Transcript_28111:70-585(-)
MDDDEKARWREQQTLSEIKRITLKARQRHTLSEEEQKVLRQYKVEEIKRLQEKHKREGLSQEERYLLAKLEESLQQEDQVVHQMESVKSEVGEALAKLQSGRSMRPKERFRLYQLLEQEEKRLEQNDDKHGLQTQEELRVLKQLRTLRLEREERKKNRKTQQDYLKLMMGG